jgi:tetratricopeptide (TPR) repeat protein
MNFRSPLKMILIVTLVAQPFPATNSWCFEGVPDKGYPASFDLEQRVNQAVKELEYSDQVAQDFVEMVRPWKCEDMHQRLLAAEQDAKQGKMSWSEYAKMEKEVASQLVETIKKEIASLDASIKTNQKFFDLALVVKKRKTQCVGYSQVFFILGTSIGLTVEGINVEEDIRGPMAGIGHVACVVDLHDGKTIQVDLTLKDSVSNEFVFSDEYEKEGAYWKLKDKKNPFHSHLTIQRLKQRHLVAAIHSNRGDESISLGKFSEAVSHCTKAIELNPTFAAAYINRGNAQYGLGKEPEALSDFGKAIEINPWCADAYYNRGTIYSSSGKVSEAISDFGKAIEFNPKCAEAYYNRGCLYGRLGKFTEAVPDFSEAIELNPNDPFAFVRRATCYAKVGKTNDARKDLLKAIHLSPDQKDQIQRIADELKLDLSKGD